MNITGFGHAPVKLFLNSGQSFVPDNPPDQSAACLQETKPSLHTYFPSVPAPAFIKKKKKGFYEENKNVFNGVIVCNHNEPAVVREVKKNGKNSGRPFYSCRRPPGHFKDPFARCQFFKWADEEINQKCYHDKLTILKSVKNHGKNHGKWYHCCKKITDDKCDFFKWADELNSVLEE